MLDERPDKRARYRFAADQLPVTKQPVVVMEPVEESNGLDLADGRTVFMSLDVDASLQDAKELADTLNRRVRRLGYVRQS